MATSLTGFQRSLDWLNPNLSSNDITGLNNIDSTRRSDFINPSKNPYNYPELQFPPTNANLLAINTSNEPPVSAMSSSNPNNVNNTFDWFKPSTYIPAIDSYLKNLTGLNALPVYNKDTGKTTTGYLPEISNIVGTGVNSFMNLSNYLTARDMLSRQADNSSQQLALQNKALDLKERALNDAIRNRNIVSAGFGGKSRNQLEQSGLLDMNRYGRA